MTEVLEKLAVYEQKGIPVIRLIELKKLVCCLYSIGQFATASIFERFGAGFQAASSEIAALLD